MARRRLTRAASLIDGFNAMYDTIGRVQADRELRQVASATPEVDTGFTDEQGQQLSAAANSGQYNVELDPATGGYKVVAKSDPNAVGTIAPGQRTTFMGKTVSGTMDDNQVHKARQLAMAGVLERNGRWDDANRVRGQLSADEDRTFNRERARTQAGREDWRFAQEQNKVDDEEAYKSGMTSVIDGSVFGTRSKAYQGAVTEYEAKKKAYDAKIAAGEDPGLAPTPPMQPTMTSAEKVLDAASVISYKAKHGKATPEELMKVGEQMAALDQEGYVKMLQMAQSQAPLTQVVAAFNAQGKAQIDPTAIVSDKIVKRPGGVESRIITYRTPDGRTQTIDTAAELAGLGKADQLLKTAKQEHDMRIQERQIGVSEGNLDVHVQDADRRQAEFEAGAGERDAKRAIAKLKQQLAETEDPEEQKRLQEKLQALQTGTRSGGGSRNLDTAQIKNAKALQVANPNVPEQTIVDNVISKPQDVYEKYLDVAGKNPTTQTKAVETARKMMSEDGWVPLGNGLWQRKGSGAGGGAAPPQGAIDKLKANPSLSGAFDQKYGAGAAARALGTKPAAAPAAPASRPGSGATTGRIATEADVRRAAALSPAEQARSNAYERSPGNMRELELAIAAEKDPQRRALLVEEARRQMAAQLAAQGAGG